MADRAPLDLTLYHSKRVIGDLVVYMTWYGVNLEDCEPCMVIIPAFRRTFKPAVICLSSAFKYVTPEHARECAMRIADFNKHLGNSDSLANVHKLATIIGDNLGDLVSCPPRPVTGSNVVGTFTMTNMSSGQATTQEIIEDV